MLHSINGVEINVYRSKFQKFALISFNKVQHVSLLIFFTARVNHFIHYGDTCNKFFTFEFVEKSSGLTSIQKTCLKLYSSTSHLCM